MWQRGQYMGDSVAFTGSDEEEPITSVKLENELAG